MLQLWLIALLAIVYIHDETGGHAAKAAAVAFSPAQVIWTLIPFIILAVAVHIVSQVAARQMDRRGSLRAVDRAERMLSISRVLVVAMHATAVFTAGWVEQVRTVMGNLIMLDEIVAILPPVLTIVAGWWSFYPIERRLRESMWVRILEEGHPAYPVPSRWQFVWSNIRHQVLFILLPLILIGAWSEEWRRVIDSHGPGVLGQIGGFMRTSAYSEPLRLVGQLGGVVIVLAISPLLMRLVWDAHPLGPGALRDRLMAVCTRAGVRVRGLLVWRTHGTMLNGAAMGLVAPLRYILLTDALLDQLPERQVESVMAHEVGHAKHHHIPWMFFALLGSMGLAVILLFIATLILTPVLAIVGHYAPRGLPTGSLNDSMQVIGSIATIGFAFTSFGWISRRFEWQADAFAAKNITREASAAKVISQESVDSMCGALESVSRLNHLPANRRSFRHGSITYRQHRLRRLVGVRLDRLPIDRTCRWIKAGIVAGVLTMILAMAALGMIRSLLDERDATHPPPKWAQMMRSLLEDRQPPKYGLPPWAEKRESTREDAP